MRKNGKHVEIADLERVMWEEIVKRDGGVSVLSHWSPSWYNFPQNWDWYFYMHGKANPLDRITLEHAKGRHRGNRALSEHWDELCLLSPEENMRKSKEDQEVIDAYLETVGEPTPRFERARLMLEQRIEAARYPNGEAAQALANQND